jgi:hypothetical protein
MERTSHALLNRSQRWWVPLLPAVIAGAALATGGLTAKAQEAATAAPAAAAPAANGFKVLPLNAELIDRKNFGPMKQTKDAVLRDDTGREWDDAAKQNMFKSYYSRYLLPAMTQPERAGELVALRQELVESTNRAANPRARDWLRQVALSAGSNFLKDNYHPSVRINGALLLGELDDRPADFLNKTPPVPTAAALPLLLEAYGSADATDGMRAATLLGILRQARFSASTWSEADQQRVFDLAKALVTSDPPAGRDLKAHAWLQARAADLLTTMPGDARKAEAYALVAALAAGKADALARYRAASMLGTLAPPAAPTVDADSLAIGWSKLLLVSLEDTLEKLVSYREPKATIPGSAGSAGYNPFGGGGYNPFGGGGPPGAGQGGQGGAFNPYGGGNFNPFGRNKDDKKKKEEEPPVDQPDDVVLARRAMNYQLEALHVGLTGKRSATERAAAVGGVEKLATAEPAKGRVSELLKLITDTQSAINQPTIAKREELVTALEGSIASLRTFVTLAEPPQADQTDSSSASTAVGAEGAELAGFNTDGAAAGAEPPTGGQGAGGQ